MENSEPHKSESQCIDEDNYLDDIKFLHHRIERPGILSIEKQNQKDIHNYLNIFEEHFAYYKMPSQVDYKDFIKWIATNSKKVLIIDDIDNLKFCLENDKTAQVLYTLIRQEEYQDKEIIFDFSLFTVVILDEIKSSNNKGYKFMDYSIRSSIRLII